MLALQKDIYKNRKCTPNIMPCRIKYNGPVIASKRYWNNTKKPDGSIIAYFRGRKLHGKQLCLPEGHRGTVVFKTKILMPREIDIPTENINEHEEPVEILEEVSEFDELMVWGHEALPDETEDLYVRGIKEWIELSNQIHSYQDEINETT